MPKGLNLEKKRYDIVCFGLAFQGIPGYDVGTQDHRLKKARAFLFPLCGNKKVLITVEYKEGKT